MPWYHAVFLTSVWLGTFFSILIYCSSNLRRLNKYRWSQGLPGQYPCFKLYLRRPLYLCPSLPEMDRDFKTYPSNVVLCGPILLPSSGSLDADIGMRSWLSRLPTVLINPGTLATFDISWVEQTAFAIRRTMHQHNDFQVLWKVKLDAEAQKLVQNAIGAEFMKRVRIEEWLATEPAELVKSGHVICSVHHGGANTFYEAAR
jgi:hypothetical protein